jgi:hypothetical protein
VRIRVNKLSTLIEAGNKRLYADVNGLAANKPRYVGVRFLRHGSDEWDRLGVRNLVVQKP